MGRSKLLVRESIHEQEEFSKILGLILKDNVEHTFIEDYIIENTICQRMSQSELDPNYLSYFPFVPLDKLSNLHPSLQFIF